MSNETKSFSWTDIEKKDLFVNFDSEDGNRVTVKFFGDPKIVSRDFDGDGNFKDQYDFPVMDQADSCLKTFTISSNRLMLKLKELRPFSDKILEIQRIGSGYETDYTVKVL